MKKAIQEKIQNFAKTYADKRLNFFDIEIKDFTADRLTLGGSVLEENNLVSLVKSLTGQFEKIRVEVGGINVLRKPENPILSVATNLTSLHISTSFLSEMISQMTYGTKVEILVENENWVFTRQSDGYLGWTYKPYLTATPQAEATHIVLAPAAELRENTDMRADVLTRVFCGTYVTVLSTSAGWAQVSANQTGWIKLADLRALSDFPQSLSERRAQMTVDAPAMIGVPYLWGGAAGYGIDCSGFTRLLHRWVGIEIPRDADMQSAQSRPVEPPYQPGDLFFFGEGGSTSRRITHVGVSMGGWNMLHSSRSRNGVYRDDVQENEHLRSIFVHAGSFLPD